MTAYDVAAIIFHDLTQSDAIGQAPPRWHYYTADQMAHCLIGVILALYRWPRAFLWLVALGWMSKEICFDIPNGGGNWLVIADSVADLVFGALGYWAVYAQRSRQGWA